MALPTDDKARKAIPVWDGNIMYFPDAHQAVAVVSRIGNDQHNPGEPLHWARGKSMDQLNTAIRHLMDHCMGNKWDKDGARHKAKAAWRILASLQLDMEDDGEGAERTEPTDVAGYDGVAEIGEIDLVRKLEEVIGRAYRESGRDPVGPARPEVPVGSGTHGESYESLHDPGTIWGRTRPDPLRRDELLQGCQGIPEGPQVGRGILPSPDKPRRV